MNEEFILKEESVLGFMIQKTICFDLRSGADGIRSALDLFKNRLALVDKDEFPVGFAFCIEFSEETTKTRKEVLNKVYIKVVEQDYFFNRLEIVK